LSIPPAKGQRVYDVLTVSRIKNRFTMSLWLPTILQKHASQWLERRIWYELFEGRAEEFGPDAIKGRDLVQAVQRYM
jgi:hypothetical protein